MSYAKTRRRLTKIQRRRARKNAWVARFVQLLKRAMHLDRVYQEQRA